MEQIDHTFDELQQAWNRWRESLTSALNAVRSDLQQDVSALPEFSTAVQQNLEQLEADITRIAGELQIDFSLELQSEHLERLRTQVEQTTEQDDELFTWLEETPLTDEELASLRQEVSDLTQKLTRQSDSKAQRETIHQIQKYAATAKELKQQQEQQQQRTADAKAYGQQLEQELSQLRSRIEQAHQEKQELMDKESIKFIRNECRSLIREIVVIEHQLKVLLD